MTMVLAVLSGLLEHRYRRHLAVLEAHGVRVAVEESPAWAVAWAEVCQPDLVVVARVMPGMAGLELASLLCDRDGPSAPIVILPEPGDQCDPSVCTHDRATGRNAIEFYPSNQIWIRIAELCGLRRARAPARSDDLADGTG